MSDGLLSECLSEVGADASDRDLLECVTNRLSNDVGARELSRVVMLVYAAALVFFMQAGFAMLCAGAIRVKNVQNTMLKNLMDACGAAIAFYTIGFAFAFGGSDVLNPKKTFVGSSNFFLAGVNDYSEWLFQYAFSAASATIVAGTLAERCQMVAYLCYSVMLTGWVYPIIVHSVWSPQGWLSAYSVDPLWGSGLVDFAGSGVVHMTGGLTALFATMILGPRRGRFHDETGRKLQVPREFPGHSVALQMLGTFILWFGWYGFNAGSALLLRDNPKINIIAPLAAANTTLSGGTAGIVALFLNLLYLERTTGEPYFDLKYAMNGSLSGLVAITGGCGVVEPWAAVVTGVFAGFFYILGSKGLIWLRLDDAVDAIPVHLVNGCWGLISVGLFASPQRLEDVFNRSEHAGWFYDGSDPTLLGIQLIGSLFIAGWVMAFMLPFFIWLDWKGWFRSDPLEEIVGLDTSYHGGVALMGPEEVNPEYISAYQRQKSNNLRRRHQASRFQDPLPEELNELTEDVPIQPGKEYRPAEPMILPTVGNTADMAEPTAVASDWRQDIDSVPAEEQHEMIRSKSYEGIASIDENGADENGLSTSTPYRSSMHGDAKSVSTMGDASAGFMEYLARAEEKERAYEGSEHVHSVSAGDSAISHHA